ncbi:unnamed protein product [Heligmosomoides polygyrus]|uniref:General transcription factor IIH subunit 3 n=1 Tax=Heligmosomoides polygyrus TaxID=6339 RepID=A0A183FM70_HELPZ|nr:unnamed protein product [Heligmosomoides polygyrus]
MSTLALLVEGSACAWGRLALLHGSETINDVIRALISFANAHLSMSALNQLLFFAFANKIKRRVSSSDASSAMLNAVRDTLRDSANSDDDRIGSPLAAVLSHAICRDISLKVGFTLGILKMKKCANVDRLLILWRRFCGTISGPLMNLFFSAAKHGICVDVVSLVEPSPLLQQAADITGGIFLQVERPSKLLSSMMVSIIQEEVDYRASCACHHELVSSGWVCSVCLSVLCQFMPICKACG